MNNAAIAGVATAAPKTPLTDSAPPTAAHDASADAADASNATPDASLARFFEVLRHAGDRPVHARSQAPSEPQAGDGARGTEPALLPGMATPMWLGLAMPTTLPLPALVPPPSSPAGNRPGEADAGTAKPASAATAPTSGPAAMAASALAADGGAPTRNNDMPSKKSALLATLGHDAAANVNAGTSDGAAPTLPRDRSAATAANATPQALTNDQAAMAASNANPAAAGRDPATTLALPADAPARWRQPLAEALGDRLQLQLGRGIDHAVIRLDPPMLGRIDISIRHDAAGGLQVQLSASNSDVLRQLHALGDSLRQDLVHRQYGEVAVQVSDSRRDGNGRQRPGQPEAEETPPGRSLAEADAGLAAGAFNLSSTRD